VKAASAVPVASEERRCQRVVDDVLAESKLPTGAVVLAVGNRRLLALGEHAGADPARLVLRPGSSVKPILAWLAAEAGVLGPREKINCSGDYATAPGFHCYGVHGELDLEGALETSCNAYFFELAHRLGLARVAAGFTRFGFTRPTGLVATEATGWVAGPEWAASHASNGTPWELLVGTGHGPIGVTLLELALAYAELAQRLGQPSREVSTEIRAEILDGLHRVVVGARGTGRALAAAGLAIAGKTGTAEPGGYAGAEPTRSDQKENGWFVGFTPLGAPEKVVAVLVLGGGNGGETAAPIAAHILRRMGEP
jgi:penicillin-binding protein 2